MDVLKVGVIGCGAIGREHIKRLHNKLQGSRVVAVMDVFPESAQRGADLVGSDCKIYDNIEGIVNDSDVDALVVTTPGFAHKEPIMAAIKAGKPVFSEKPLATTAADCKEIVDAEMAGGKKLVQVGFMRRYDKGYRQVKELLDGGTFGKPLLAKCTHRAISVDPSYTTDMAVTDTAIHEIDCMHWLLDDDWTQVQVIMGADTKHAHEGLKDPQIMIFKSKKGYTVILEVYVNSNFGYDINCEVVCEEGVINLPAPAYPTVRKNQMISTPIEQDWINRFIDSYDVELQEWIDDTKKGEVNGPSAWDGYIAAVTADGLVASQTSGVMEDVSVGETPEFYR
ncbi:MAG: Gfo/Idh/MocA family protein [Fastidiosipilaceae bacterium]|jgi:myo-inositol 2-dehydrogenase/D-chiro-inositol 1-dehydrogenase|nr:Gfo/Idh/MocA family oxidoreductase [Clostridiaceae bacterium]